MKACVFHMVRSSVVVVVVVVVVTGGTLIATTADGASVEARATGLGPGTSLSKESL